jgi:hypothetical protein
VAVLICTSAQFSNLCGTVYGGGNVVFGLDGDTLLSPVGNRVTVFDLVKGSCRTLPCQSRSNICNLVLSPDGSLLVTVDTEGHALFINYHSSSVLHHFNFKGRVPHAHHPRHPRQALHSVHPRRRDRLRATRAAGVTLQVVCQVDVVCGMTGARPRIQS